MVNNHLPVLRTSENHHNLNKIILNEISNLLTDGKKALRISMRQRAKFEGWLKFELAYRLENYGMKNIEIEKPFSSYIPDISFFHNDTFHRIELKTCNTNWSIKGVEKKGKPISNNIKSIIRDTRKLNSESGIVAFIMFPIPLNDDRWKKYINRIEMETELQILNESNCRIMQMEIDEVNKCNLLICVFKSRKFSNWW